MRGENPSQPGEIWPESGSSPHARGKQEVGSMAGGLTGLIPACAGKTGISGLGAPAHGAHPRMRGENFKSCSIP